MNKKLKTIIIIICSLLLILALIFVIRASKSEDESYKKNNYKFLNSSKDLPGTKLVKNDKLASEHCLNGICLVDTVIHDNSPLGVVTYTIINKSGENASDVIKMHFTSGDLLVAYSISKDEKISSSSQYNNLDLSKEEDFTLVELTSEEKSKINVQ